MRVPIDPTVMKAYRDALAIPASPSFIDTDLPIQPVAVIASASSAANAQNVIITDGTDTTLVTSGGRLQVSAEPSGALSTEKTYICKMLSQTATLNTQYTVHTVTALKKLYVNQIIINPRGNVFGLRFGDNVSGNANLGSGTTTSNSLSVHVGAAYSAPGVVINFKQPMEISTAFIFITDSTFLIDVGIVGFEE